MSLGRRGSENLGDNTDAIHLSASGGAVPALGGQSEGSAGLTGKGGDL